MKILALDTSTEACSLALLAKDNTATEAKVISRHVVAPMQHAKLILGMIEELMRSGNTALNQLDAIAFGCGPGSFTGLRLVTSVVQAIGFTNKIPVIPVSSLTAMAQSAYHEYQMEKVAIAVDAKKDQLYFSACEVGPNGLMRQVLAECLLAPQDLDLAPFAAWPKIGDAWEAYSNKMSVPVGMIPIKPLIIAPNATAILDLAVLAFEKNQWILPIDAIPVYLNPYKS